MLFLTSPFHRPNSYFTRCLPDRLILTIVVWTDHWVSMWSSNHWDPTLSPSIHPIPSSEAWLPFWLPLFVLILTNSLCLLSPRRTLSSFQLGAGTCHPRGAFSDTAFLSAWASEHCSSGASPYHMSSLFIAIVSTNHALKPWPQIVILLGNQTYWFNLEGQLPHLLSMPFSF